MDSTQQAALPLAPGRCATATKRPPAIERLKAALPQRPLNVLQFGGGVDSFGFAARYLGINGLPRLRLPFEIDAFFFEDHGADLPHTYEAVEWFEQLAARQGIPFIVIEHDDDVVAPSKRYPLHEAYMRQPKPGIPTRVPRSCTLSRKVSPCAALLNAHYDLRRGKWRAGDLVDGVAPGTRHRVILGFAADEPRRALPISGDDGLPFYVHDRRDWIQVYTPMMQLGITRDDCLRAIAAARWPSIGKSACFCCSFAPPKYFFALQRVYPELYETALKMEQASRSHNPRLTFLGAPLEEVVAHWIDTHQPLPDPWQVLKEAYPIDGCWG